jgi:chemotaxis signal transduction protein
MSTVDAAAEEAAAADAVVVRLGRGRYAADLASVAEVGRVPTVTRIPGVPHWLAGVANWRGRLLPVLDLRPLLDSEVAPLGAQARLVVLCADGVTAGVVVDAVEGTRPLGDVDELPTALTGAAVQLLGGQVPLEDGPVAVLDVPAVLRLRDQLPRARRSA